MEFALWLVFFVVIGTGGYLLVKRVKDAAYDDAMPALELTEGGYDLDADPMMQEVQQEIAEDDAIEEVGAMVGAAIVAQDMLDDDDDATDPNFWADEEPLVDMDDVLEEEPIDASPIEPDSSSPIEPDSSSPVEPDSSSPVEPETSFTITGSSDPDEVGYNTHTPEPAAVEQVHAAFEADEPPFVEPEPEPEPVRTSRGYVVDEPSDDGFSSFSDDSDGGGFDD
jgi:hypothetical protein